MVKANTVNVPMRIIGLRPYLSANFPQKIDVRALPIMNDDAKKKKKIINETSMLIQDLVIKKATTNSKPKEKETEAKKLPTKPA